MAGSDVDNTDVLDVRSSLGGDEDAYWRIVERYGPNIQRQMRNFTRDPLMVDELAQDVFVEAFTSLANYRFEAPLGHWLSRIASRVGCKFWRSRDKRKREVSLDSVPDMPSREEVEQNPALASEILFALFAALPDDDRLAMTLAYLERCPHEEIGKRIGCSTEMVAVRLHRAKDKIRKMGRNEPWKGKLACLIS